jgi:hypothetical protein
MPGWKATGTGSRLDDQYHLFPSLPAEHCVGFCAPRGVDAGDSAKSGHTTLAYGRQGVSARHGMFRESSGRIFCGPV